jgi:hypothetical protein
MRPNLSELPNDLLRPIGWKSAAHATGISPSTADA